VSIVLEVAVQDPGGAAAAARGGADRVELCSALALGGLTPSGGLVAAAVAVGLPVHVLIRPRAGGFDYTDAERALVYADVQGAVDAGAAGVVVGATRAGKADLDLVQRVRELAGQVEVTFHRAFDTLLDRAGALEQLIGVGVDRVLTSGGATRAPDALPELAALAEQARGRIQVMAGAGIDVASVAAVAATGVPAVHSSAKRLVRDPLPVGLGSLAESGEVVRETTDEQVVRALRAALDRAGEPR